MTDELSCKGHVPVDELIELVEKLRSKQREKHESANKSTFTVSKKHYQGEEYAYCVSANRLEEVIDHYEPNTTTVRPR